MAPTTAPLIPYVAINKFLFFPLYPNLLATNLPLYEPATAPTIPPTPTPTKTAVLTKKCPLGST